jgi:hypothetical protein
MNIILAILLLIMFIPSSQHREIKNTIEFDPILENTIPAIEPLPEIINVEPKPKEEKTKRKGLLKRIIRKSK